MRTDHILFTSVAIMAGMPTLASSDAKWTDHLKLKCSFRSSTHCNERGNSCTKSDTSEGITGNILIDFDKNTFIHSSEFQGIPASSEPTSGKILNLLWYPPEEYRGTVILFLDSGRMVSIHAQSLDAVIQSAAFAEPHTALYHCKRVEDITHSLK
ncbi:hypothetical protein FJQ54_14190 [Sandaracinobacter neustonicus]|uniref:Uncharacterized protein n=1 Tax=Sandaracinobacter neustonicus TaxID=1715348 RepID=A0A501XF34_9SPHN|nr:hypothetical protein [Sandaracinobacter neustonicus]TPE59211.1 hypothetical protein FJQ54_14190 [Sandaracinobacter neustonicus]